ncbi:Tubulin-specific chaperone E [Seminavis robusta]|uniref:Tubulin-specific chaperone E n=1 Tax=Seminavis robusta TaxID=568900 RepID=A0A9N8DZG6_9STRA|nr:Tubulin-specific chaperone E [Seminavis robusta]|eukprot:Sro500_g155370.1 Tubulin-specific chaperone E (624) ;mRNA; r:59286-61243
MMSSVTTTTSTELSTSSITAGVTRIQDVDGYVGTVVYVGPVASAKDPTEHYAGVIWDDPSRGKHDGSVVCRRTNELVRHFSCAHPCGASFLRLSKLNLGVALNAALLRSKYVTTDSDELVAPNNLLQHTARTAQGHEKPIEFYGELKIRSHQQLEDLQTISLRRMGIAHVEQSKEWQEFQHLTALDLTGNLLSDWDTVLDILQQFPNLTDLNVAANRIRDPSKETIEQAIEQQYCQQAPFSALANLNLNHCGIESVQTLLWIGRLLPQLQQLCMAHANLGELDAETGRQAADTFEHLTQLDLTNCHLTSWSKQVVPLCSTLSCLQLLILDDNPIDTTNTTTEQHTDETETTTNYFSQLESLHLAGTQIATWQDLDGLLQFPKLTSLRFRRCPLLESMGTGEARAIAIARLGPNSTKLNASVISPKERHDAEKRYVSSVASQLLSLDASARDQFVQQYHKAFPQLLEQYKDIIVSAATAHSPGDDESPRSVAATSTSMVVNVSIQSMAASSCHQEPMVRRLPGSLPIKRIKAMCARTFGLDPDLQRLHFCTEFDAFPTELDDDEHTLAYYGVSDGATIFMNEIDLDAIKRQQEKVKQEQLSNLERQEALEVQKQQHKQQLLQKH